MTATRKSVPQSGWWEGRGKRYYMRSKWERNYADWLEFRVRIGEVVDWEYEPRTFWFLEIKRGVRSYKPDFLVRLADGTEEFHELKGWLDPQSKTKIKRMRIYYPEVNLVLIDAKRYKGIMRSFGRKP